jgi:hypothetical protein
MFGAAAVAESDAAERLRELARGEPGLVRPAIESDRPGLLSLPSPAKGKGNARRPERCRPGLF